MDIEQLNKSQIVLLTLLVSFVTSIATGIVTVSLMDQAPPVVAQTVNRVIERTIETVAATSTAKGQPATAVVTQTKTVVVNQSDLVSQAVQKITPSIVKLYTSDAVAPQFLGLGLVLDAKGIIATDNAALADQADAVAVLPDGTKVRAFASNRDKDSGIALLTATGTPSGISWKPIVIATDHPVLGESIIGIAGRTSQRIASGYITSLMQETGSPLVLDTDIASGSILPGSPIINTDGSVVGVSTGAARASSPTGFISAASLIASSPAPADAKK